MKHAKLDDEAPPSLSTSPPRHAKPDPLYSAQLTHLDGPRCWFFGGDLNRVLELADKQIGELQGKGYGHSGERGTSFLLSNITRHEVRPSKTGDIPACWVYHDDKHVFAILTAELEPA